MQEEKAQREAAEARAADLQRAMQEQQAAAAAAAAASLAAELAKRQAVEVELAAARQQVSAAGDSAAAAQQQLQAEVAELKGKLEKLEKQKADLEVRSRGSARRSQHLAPGCTRGSRPLPPALYCSGASCLRLLVGTPQIVVGPWSPCPPPPQARAQATEADLHKRLNNAVAQRNAAREEALMLSAQLKKLEEDVEAGRLVVPVAVGAAAAAGMATPPPAAAAAAAAAQPPGSDEGMMDRMRRFMQQIPGTSPLRDVATPVGGWTGREGGEARLCRSKSSLAECALVCRLFGLVVCQPLLLPAVRCRLSIGPPCKLTPLLAPCAPALAALQASGWRAPPPSR